MTFLQYFWFVFAAKTKSEMAANNDFSCSGLPFAQLLTNPTYFLSNRQTYLFTFLNLFLAMSLTCRTNFLPKTNLWKIFHNIITGWSRSWLVVDWRKSTTERCEYNNKNRWFYKNKYKCGQGWVGIWQWCAGAKLAGGANWPVCVHCGHHSILNRTHIGKLWPTR